MRSFAKFLFSLCLLGLVFTPSPRVQGIGGDQAVWEQSGQFAVDWMQLLYDRVWAQSINAPAAARIYGYAGVILYESLYWGLPDNYSLVGQVNGLTELPIPNSEATYDWTSVANQTLLMTLTSLMDNGTPAAEESAKAFQELYDKYRAEREATAGRSTVNVSVKFGEQMGEVFLDWINSDGFADTRGLPYEIPTGDDSLWVKTNPDLPVAEPYWGQLRTTGLEYADVCAIRRPTPEFSTDPESAFYLQAAEVMEVGDNLTEEQKFIARFWIDTPGESGAPAGHWVLIENQLVKLLDLKLNKAAEMYALVGMTLSDAFIAAWSLKYQMPLLRPVTYINRYINPRWQSYLQTPNFPEYPSGHSVVSGAAAEVLTRMFGIVAFTDSSGVKRDLAPRSFTSFEAAASEAAISRMYGGIHYRTAIENGLRMGRCIGNSIVNRISLRPQPQGE